MPLYRVYVPEVYLQPYDIMADSPEEAIELVRDGEGEMQINLRDYCFTLAYEDCQDDACWSCSQL